MERSAKLNTCFWILLLFIFSGCSQQNIRARWLLFQAEQIFYKANYQLRAQKVSFDDRKPYYRKACQGYDKAYRLDPALFTSPKLEEAHLSCMNAELRAKTDLFSEALDTYCKTHPKECEYGMGPSPEWSEF